MIQRKFTKTYESHIQEPRENYKEKNLFNKLKIVDKKILHGKYIDML